MSEKSESKKELSQEMKTFAGGIAHDLNNLFTAILGYVDLLEETLEGQPQALQDLKDVEQTITRGYQMSRDLHLLAAPDAQVKETVPLSEIAGTILEGCRLSLVQPLECSDFQFKNQGTNLVFGYPPAIRQHLPKLIKVLSNMASNETEVALYLEEMQEYYSFIVAFGEPFLSSEEAEAFFLPYQKSQKFHEKTGLRITVLKVKLMSSGVEVNTVRRNDSVQLQLHVKKA